MSGGRKVNIPWLVAGVALLVTAFVSFDLGSGSCTPSRGGPPTCGSSTHGVVAVIALAGAAYCLYRGLRRRT